MCIHFLRQLLAHGPVRATIVQAKARDAGFTPKQLWLAKVATGVRSRKHPGWGTGWSWFLPGLDEPPRPAPAPQPMMEKRPSRVVKVLPDPPRSNIVEVKPDDPTEQITLDEILNAGLKRHLDKNVCMYVLREHMKTFRFDGEVLPTEQVLCRHQPDFGVADGFSHLLNVKAYDQLMTDLGSPPGRDGYTRADAEAAIDATRLRLIREYRRDHADR